MVTGGIGNTVNTPHSGRAYFGTKPKSSISSSESFSSLVLISIGFNLFSSSRKVVGFSKVIFFCLALHQGHLFTVFKLEIRSFKYCLLASVPASFSILSSSCLALSILFLGIKILPQSLHVHFKKFIITLTN